MRTCASIRPAFWRLVNSADIQCSEGMGGGNNQRRQAGGLVARGGGRGRRAGERADGRHPGAGVVSTAANPVDQYPYGHMGRAGLSAGNENRAGTVC